MREQQPIASCNGERTEKRLTLEMSGGLKRAQHALERPLDRRVGPQPGGRECCAHLPMVARQACTASLLRGRERLTLAGQAEPCLDRARGSSGNRTCAVPSLTGRPLAAEGRTARRALNGDGRRDLGAGPLSRNADAARDQRIHFFGDKLTVSGPPTDGQPGRERLETALQRDGSATLRAHEERTVAGLDHSAARTTCLTNWGPTFDMSGGPKGAKRPLERPLDGGVRRQREPHPRTSSDLKTTMARLNASPCAKLHMRLTKLALTDSAPKPSRHRPKWSKD